MEGSNAIQFLTQKLPEWFPSLGEKLWGRTASTTVLGLLTCRAALWFSPAFGTHSDKISSLLQEGSLPSSMVGNYVFHRTTVPIHWSNVWPSPWPWIKPGLMASSFSWCTRLPSRSNPKLVRWKSSNPRVKPRNISRCCWEDRLERAVMIQTSSW